LKRSEFPAVALEQWVNSEAAEHGGNSLTDSEVRGQRRNECQGTEQRQFLQYLKRLILSIKHQEMSGEGLDLFLNCEADQLEAWSAAVAPKPIAHGFVLFGKEIGRIFQELQ